ncbi:MAG: hypothetical protein SO484_05725 [Bacilli bacterium]|nr:hypothetical protein [Bacilli bacterium]
MISKKSRKVVAVLLIGATVCASGTFAYFNSKVDLNNLGGTVTDDAKKLDISNGKVKITGKIGGSELASLTKVWSYDVARLSTADTLANRYKKSSTDDIIVRTGSDDTGYSIAKLSDQAVADYVNVNKSPDITGVGKVTSNRAQKAEVGDAVTGKITLARPGDAFVLGSVKASGEETDTETGLEVVNESTLTTKVNIIASESNDVTAATTELNRLFKGGWQLYVAIDTKESGSTSTYTTNAYKLITSVSELQKLAPTSLKPGQSFKVRMRVELPLITNNAYQDPTKTKGDQGDAITAVDLMKLFDIKVTQENNPGFSVDGTKNVVSDDDVSNYPTSW